MGVSLCEAIKTRFEAAESGLCPGSFSGLYTGLAPDPDDCPRPYCVLEPPDQSKASGSFASTYHRETFKFHVIADSLDALKPLVAAIDAIYDNKEAQMSVSGLQFLQLEKAGESFAEGDVAAEAILEYMTLYRKARN